MANIKFQTMTPYDQQMESLARRQRIADMLQQQSMDPLESQTAPGGMVVPTSPVLGLIQMLKGGLAGYQQGKIGKERTAAEAADRQSGMDFLKNMTQGQQTQVSPDQAMEASMSPTPTDFPARQPVLSGQERTNALIGGAMGGSPRTQQIAQMLMAQKQPSISDYVNKIDVKDIDPASLRQLQEDLRAGRQPDMSSIRLKDQKQDAVRFDRKTRTTVDSSGNQVHQDYNFNPATGEDTVVGLPYKGAPRAGAGEDKEKAAELRKEFTGQTSQYRTIADAYQKVQESAKNPSPANDISLVFGFMRINDPNSSVKEGEYATAKNAASVPERIRNIYNNALNGELLSPTQRQDFIKSSYGMVSSQIPNVEALSKRYSDIARRSGLRPEDVVFDPFSGISKPTEVPKPYSDKSTEDAYQQFKLSKQYGAPGQGTVLR